MRRESRESIDARPLRNNPFCSGNRPTRFDLIDRMKFKAGDHIEPRELESINFGQISLPHESLITHIQFRRFAGCPICNLHLQSFNKRFTALEQAGIAEVVVFHSSKEDMLKYHADAPFPMIADPSKRLYKELGVESSLTSIMHPQAWLPAVKGLFANGAALPGRGESPLGLPADFLIQSDGKILAAKYGQHADDHWSVDEVIDLAKSLAFGTQQKG